MESAPPIRRIDLNADLGEYTRGDSPANDDVLLQLVTSASVACGGHAGDEWVMRQTARTALRLGVCIGAHPGYPDREGFGRREIDLDSGALTRELTAQLMRFRDICESEGARLAYVKPHGALYNTASRSYPTAAAILRACALLDDDVQLLAPPGSELERAGVAAGRRVAREAFIDRAYQPDGRLVPRSEPGAVLHDVADAVRQALAIAVQRQVRCIDGSDVRIEADSLCVHGDNFSAAEILTHVRAALTAASVQIAAFACT